MEKEKENNNLLLIKFFFISSIEKNFYKERTLEYIPSKNANKNITDFQYTEFFEEEIKLDNKLYLNKLNCISFQTSTTQILNNNIILLKIKDGTKNYLYECLIEYDFQNINKDKLIYFIYNFEIGELRKDNALNNDTILKDSIINIQTSIIEMKENSISQRKLNFYEKLDFFLKAIKNNKSKDIFLIINLLLDTIKEVEYNHIKNKVKIEFIELLKIIKIIYEDIYIEIYLIYY